jgi:hypothetical protein
MRIRITRQIPHDDALLYPGEVYNFDEKLALELIKQEYAIAYPEEEVEVIPRKRTRKNEEVKDVNG